MRILLSIILAPLAVAAFCLFFGLHAVLSYVDSPDAVSETAHEQGLHELAVEAADALLADEFRPPPGPNSEALRAYVRKEAHKVFEEILSEDWFYESLNVGYSVLLAILHERDEDRAIELAVKKQQLAQSLDRVAVKVSERCRKLIGGSICEGEANRARAVRPVRLGIQAAVAQIPDRLDIEDVTAAAGHGGLRPDSPEMERVREGLGAASMIRYAALAGFALVLILIALLNRSSGRMLVAVGMVLAVSAMTFLVAVRVAEDASRDAAAEVLRERTSAQIPAQAGSVRDIAVRGTEKLTLGAANDAIHQADGVVMMLGAAAAAAAVVGLVVGRRRK